MVGRVARLRARPDLAGRLAVPLVILLALVWVDARILTPTENTKDSALYQQLGVDLARTGTYGTAGTPTREVEPMHSALIALQVRLDPRLSDALATGEVATGRPSRALKQQNLLWGGILLAGVAVQVQLLMRGRRGAPLAAVTAVVAVTLLLLENPDVVDRNLAELPAAAVLTWSGVVATRLAQRPGPARAAALGAFIGLLALTRAVFAYVAVPYLLLLGVLLWAALRTHNGAAGAARRVGVLTLAGLLGFAAVAGPWAVRNAQTFGDPALAERGGEVLLIRANKNRMDGYQLRGALVHWTATEAQPALARLLQVDLADFAPDRPLAVHLRDSDDLEARAQAFYRLTQVQIDELRDVRMAEGMPRAVARWDAEAELGAAALAEMRADPLAVLRTTPAFLWRFSWPMNLSSTVPRILLAPINLVAMTALLLAAAYALIGRRPELFAVAGLPAGATAFYVLVTHALPRYARPLAPTMIVLLVVAGAALVERVAGRRPGIGT